MWRNHGMVLSVGVVASGGDNILPYLTCSTIAFDEGVPPTREKGLLTGELGMPKIEACGSLGTNVCCCMKSDATLVGLDPGTAAGTRSSDSIGSVEPTIGVPEGSCEELPAYGAWAGSCRGGPGCGGRNNDCKTSGSVGGVVCTVAVTCVVVPLASVRLTPNMLRIMWSLGSACQRPNMYCSVKPLCRVGTWAAVMPANGPSLKVRPEATKAPRDADEELCEPP